MTFDRKHKAHPNFDLHKPQAGEFISAAEYRKLKDYVQQLVTHYLNYDGPPIIRLFKLTESIGPEFDDSSDWRKKSGKLQYWDENAQLWRTTDDERENLSDAFELVWDKDDVVVAFYHNQAQQYVPINQRTVRAVITVPDEDGDYPDSASVPNPNKFPIKFVRLTYTQSAGYEDPTLTYVDSGSASPAEVGPDDYVLNLYEHLEADCDCGSNYIPCYTVIWAWHQNYRWYTHTCCHNNVSSQSSKSSSSESSASSSSLQFSSSSSGGFSSSSSSRGISSSSSSRGVSSSSSSVGFSSSSSSTSTSSTSTSSPSSQSPSSASSQSASSQSPSSGGSSVSSGGSSISSGGSSASSGGSSVSGASSGASGESSKSAAIVPASWSPTGYTALFVVEAPDVRFDDVMVAEITEKRSYVPIDERFIEVCEPNSLEACGVTPDIPVAIGAVVVGDNVRVLTGAGHYNGMPVRLVIRLTGIRKGFAGVRFPDRNREQFLANERFLQMAKPTAEEMRRAGR